MSSFTQILCCSKCNCLQPLLPLSADVKMSSALLRRSRLSRLQKKTLVINLCHMSEETQEVKEQPAEHPQLNGDEVIYSLFFFEGQTQVQIQKQARVVDECPRGGRCLGNRSLFHRKPEMIL